MEQAAIGLAFGFLLLLCVVMWDAKRQLANSLERAENQNCRLADMFGQLMREKTPALTAKELAKPFQSFRTRKSWKDERAELEAQNNTKEQAHDRRVEEFESQAKGSE